MLTHLEQGFGTMFTIKDRVELFLFFTTFFTLRALSHAVFINYGFGLRNSAFKMSFMKTILFFSGQIFVSSSFSGPQVQKCWRTPDLTKERLSLV